MLKNRTALVAGGAGFVGSHLCEKLLALGYKVICVDNLYTGKKTNILNLLKNKNFQFLNKDISKDVLNLKINEIYHLASPASPPAYQKEPILTFKSNTLGTLNLLELAKKNKAKFLFASTSEVYGDPKEHPQKETYWGNVNPVGVRSCYDESKRAGETLTLDFGKVYKIETKIIRIFNTYGPKMDKNDGRVVSNFIVQALKNMPITVYGQGGQTRSFQYVSDLVAGIIAMMNAKNFSGPVNLGNPEEFTILELAKKIIKITNSKSKIVFKKLPQDDPVKRKPDIDLAKKRLKWQPKISVSDGLLKTITYFKQSLNKK
jgi:UDP-glucuronate decarboxylase